MKLIYCKGCQDVIKLIRAYRQCRCGHSGGRYLDYAHSEIWGSAIPLGIDYRSLGEALKERPKEGKGSLFTAFVIPEECDTVEEV